MSKRIYLLVYVALILFPAGSMAAKVTITASKDAYVSSENPDLNYGGASILSVKSELTIPSSNTENAYLIFDLDLIPPDATINLAYLLMYDPATGVSFDVSVLNVTSSWFETGDNGITWNNLPTSGTDVLDGVPKYAVPGVYYADITSLVTQWHAGSISNHGILLRRSGVGTPHGSRFFNSREAATGKPELLVIYDCESMEIMPEMDSFVSIDDPTANYGTSTDLQIRSRGRWSYLQFSADSVPPGANVEFVRLRMYHYSGSDPLAGFSVGPCMVTSSWDESTVTWLGKPTDTATPESIKGNVGFWQYFGWLDLDISNLFNSWRNGTNPNYGVVVKYPPDDGTSSSPPLGKFRSSEYAGEEYRPRLEVLYSTPTANVFTATQDLTAVRYSDASWGDMDNDGDLDVVLCGDSYASVGRVTVTYENNNGSLIVHPNNLPGVQNQGNGCLAWGDIDRDGDLDLAMAGMSDAGSITRVYTNDGDGDLTWDTGQVLTGMENASLSWGDVDRDGDLDLYVQGYNGSSAAAILYENDSGTLVQSSQVLTGFYNGSADWADIDGNGWLDLIVTGRTDTEERVTECYMDSAGTLQATGARGLPLVNHSDIAFGDVDRDGDLDVAITGSTGAEIQITCVYLNDGTGNFNLMWSGNGLYQSSCAFGDFDNDGYLDVAFCGYNGTLSRTHIYRYDNGTYTFFVARTSVNEGSVSWADIDDDGDLDFLLTGKIDFGSPRAILFDNSLGNTNTRPSPPNEFTEIRHSGSGADTLYLRWSGASDNETWHKGLYYCLQVGTSRGGNDILSGTYSTPLMGNVGQATQLNISIPDSTQHCYWRVKTIDTGLMASDWSIEQCSWDPDSLMPDALLSPSDDSYVVSFWPDTADGGWGYLMVGNIAVPADEFTRTYLKFNIGAEFSDSFVAVESAELHLYCSSVDCTTDYYVGVWGEKDDVWNEAGLTWYNAPIAFDPYPTDVIRVETGYCVWDVTECVVGTHDSLLTFVLRGVDPLEGTPDVWVDFHSKENQYGMEPYLSITYATTVDIPDGNLPRMQRVLLSQNFPNPFNPHTRISYTIPDGSQASPVLLRIFDAAGRLVKTLIDEPQPAGIYLVTWDGSNRNGNKVASGVYFYQLQWNGKRFARKMVLLR